MACKRCLALLILFLGLHQCSGQFNYIINPSSYLDVVNPPPGSSSYKRAQQQGHVQQDEYAAPSSAARKLLASPRATAPYNVCVSDWTPMVKCSADTAQADFKGYQVELFRMLADDIGWKDTQYSFTCMSFSDMMADLKSPNGSCSLTATGVEVSLDNLASNLKFSWPTYKSGLRVMIHAQLQTGSTWAFSEVFHWSVWLALGATAVAVGLLVAFIEWITPNQYGETKKGWQSWAWYSLAKMMHIINHVGDPTADASRILVLGYGFLVLVMVSMYTATSASRITAEKLVHPVHGKKDLPGRKVLTWNSYVGALKEHHDIVATGMPWDTEDDKNQMIADLRAGRYEALVLDSPVLEYTVGTNDKCDLFTVGEPFETFSLALAFPSDFSDATVFAFSSSIVRLQTYQGALDMLENVYIKTGGTSKCFGDNSGHGTGKMISLYQVSGLWYILCMTIGLCFILTVVHNIRKDPVKMQRIRTARANIVKRISGTGAQAPAGSVPSGTPGGDDACEAPSKPSQLKMFLGVAGSADKDDEAEPGEDEASSPHQRSPSPLKHNS